MSKESRPEPGFHRGFYTFLTELSKNNNRDWFQKNKTRYDTQVRDPSLEFIRGVGPRLRHLSAQVDADPRPVGGSMMRIYRDLRFSKDKRPYRTSVGIHFSHVRSGSMGESLPGFFLHLEPGENYVASGMWRPDPPQLRKIREAIAERSSEWKRTLGVLPELEGDSLQRPPPGFDPQHPLVRDLKRKDFITSVAIKDAEVVRSNFPAHFLAKCTSINPLNRFLAQAVDIPW